MIDVEVLSRAIAQAEKRVEREVGEAKAMAARVKQDMAEAEQMDERVIALEEAIGVMNSFADKKQKEIQQKIELLVTHGLQAIFDDSLTFHIVQTERARRVETNFTIKSKLEDGTEIETSILDARGGGVAAVAGFLLRLIIMLLRKNTRQFLLLDESFAHVSDHYEPKLVEFVRELVDKTPTQMVVITHKAKEEWTDAADRAYEFSLHNGKTKVKDISTAKLPA